MLDPDGRSHYEDYGELRQLAKAYTDGFVFSGEYCRFRHRTHGGSSVGVPGERFIVFNQNHDLPGNRPDGARLSKLVTADRVRLAAAAVMLSPYLPMLFMGEEYGDDSPFYFFADYQEGGIASDLAGQRRQQFANFNWKAQAPDPLQPATFLDCILKWEKRQDPGHRELLEWYRQLISLRKGHPQLAGCSREYLRADLLGIAGLAISRCSSDRRQQLLTLFNFSAGPLDTVISVDSPMPVDTVIPVDTARSVPGPQPGTWTKIISSPETAKHVTPGHSFHLPPWSVAVYERRAPFNSWAE